MTLVSQGCPDPANDLLVKLIVLEIEAMNELVETATEFEACYAQVGGKGGALGKNGLIKNFLVRLKVVVDYIDRDRTIGRRTVRRSCAVLAIRLGLIRLNEVIRFEVHGFDAKRSYRVYLTRRSTPIKPPKRTYNAYLTPRSTSIHSPKRTYRAYLIHQSTPNPPPNVHIGHT